MRVCYVHVLRVRSLEGISTSNETCEIYKTLCAEKYFLGVFLFFSNHLCLPRPLLFLSSDFHSGVILSVR
jgi:hypothetical protein